MANVGQWRASSVASNEPPAAPCKPDGPLRWLTKPSSDFWPTSSAGSRHIPDLKAFNRASLKFKVQSRKPGTDPFSGVKKAAQFCSVLLSFGLVRVAEWIERRVEQKAARERRTNR